MVPLPLWSIREALRLLLASSRSNNLRFNIHRSKQRVKAEYSRRAAPRAAAEPAATSAAAEPAAKSAQSRRALREATARAVRAHSVTQSAANRFRAGRSSNAGLGWSGIPGARPETPRACAKPSRDYVMTDRSARSLTLRCTDPSRSSQLFPGAGVAGSACCA